MAGDRWPLLTMPTISSVPPAYPPGRGTACDAVLVQVCGSCVPGPNKAQGSQWQRIIIMATGFRLLARTLLYTAITRAQTQVLPVGDVATAAAAVHALPRSIKFDLDRLLASENRRSKTARA